MTIIADPEERQVLEALCDWLATKCAWPPHEAPAKNAHVILQDALTKPEKPDGLRQLCERLVVLSGNELPTATQWHDLCAKALLIQKRADADSARRNAEANKPAFPNGRIGSKGGV